MTTESTTSSIVIRTYQPSDLPACQDIFRKVHRSYDHPVFYIDEVMQTDMADIEKNYLADPNGNWWVAVSTDDNRVVGHVAVLPLNLGSPSYYRELPEGERDQVCEVLRMAVDPDAQRGGVGTKLLAALINFAREKGYRQIHLTTLTSMDKACGFYERNGFIRGRIERSSFDFDSVKSIEEMKALLKHQVSPVTFEVGAVIPEEDLRLMKQLPSQSKFMYVQHYSLKL